MTRAENPVGMRLALAVAGAAVVSCGVAWRPKIFVIITAITTSTQRYIGGYQEASNLYILGARYYDATTGRFTQFDPAGQEANPYTYASCNLINAKDPTGMVTAGCFLAFALGVFAVAGLIVATAGGGFGLAIAVLVFVLSLAAVADACEPSGLASIRAMNR